MRTAMTRICLIVATAAATSAGSMHTASAQPVTQAPAVASTPAALPAANSWNYVFDFDPIQWPSYSIHSRGGAVTAAYLGWSVSSIQARLNSRIGAKLKVDGRFGYGTQAAVIKFQRSRGLTPDGYVGPKTWRALGLTKEIIR